MSAPLPPLLLLLSCAVVGRLPVALGLQCYVCVPQSETNITDVVHIFQKFPANLTCEGFTAHNQRYVWDCPNNYTGCVMVTDGLKVVRTCGELPVNDCKMANKVEYCYCKEPLCNGGGYPAAKRTFVTAPPRSPPSDDEDLEGSGGGPPADNRRSPNTATMQSTTATTTRSNIPTSAAVTSVRYSLHRTVLIPAPLLLLLTYSAWTH